MSSIDEEKTVDILRYQPTQAEFRSSGEDAEHFLSRIKALIGESIPSGSDRKVELHVNLAEILHFSSSAIGVLISVHGDSRVKDVYLESPPPDMEEALSVMNLTQNGIVKIAEVSEAE